MLTEEQGEKLLALIDKLDDDDDVQDVYTNFEMA
jgi:transcriptional/translational regulatory protein YebC/TACO1